MTRVAILGATGYTAYELIRILLRHPQVEITAVTSRSDTRHITEVHPVFHGMLNLSLENLSAEELADRAEYVFCCLPHGASMETIPQLMSAGAKVVDLSADYRLDNPAIYEQWYGLVHTDPTRLGDAVYGLPELFAKKIAGQELVANPGCYTSTSILALAPLLAEKLIEPQGIIIDAKSGVSGAGRTPKLTNLYSEVNESFTAYGVGNHRHTPEIEQVLSTVSEQDVHVTFTPHLVPMDRGILCTIYAQQTGELGQTELLERIRTFYSGKPFVRVVEHIPATKHVAHTNFCDITVRLSRGQLIVFAALDNLIKGAAGVAVQNFNLLAGFPETTALI